MDREGLNLLYIISLNIFELKLYYKNLCVKKKSHTKIKQTQGIGINGLLSIQSEDPRWAYGSSYNIFIIKYMFVCFFSVTKQKGFETRKLANFKTRFLIIMLHVCVIGVHVCADDWGCWRHRMLPKLLRAVVGCPALVVGTEWGSPKSTVHTCNPDPPFQPQGWLVFVCFVFLDKNDVSWYCLYFSE